jgi:hypothetical protein
MTTKIKLFTLSVGLLLITACSGGGGGGGNGSAVPTKATLKLATFGTGTTIYGIDVTVDLAEGVTVKSSAPPLIDPGVVTPSGGAQNFTIATAVYTAASGTVPAKVRILVANTTGFTTGEFCTVNADIAAGHSPKAGDFSLESFSTSDANGNVINGLSGGVTAEIF